MKEPTYGGVVSKAEMKLTCSSPVCKKYPHFEDWSGWRWCLKHWLRDLRWSGVPRWFYFKSTKINL